MALMISCGGNSSSGGSSVSNFGKLGGECYPNETCDEGLLCDTENNVCVEDPENPIHDSDTSSEQTNDNEDILSEQNDDKTDTASQNDNDSADDGDTIDPDITDSGETDGETRVQDCTGLPENAEWNTVSSITQRWDGEKWVPSAVASFNFEGSENECRFKCATGYTWDGSQCVQPSDPCDPNPCIDMPNSKGTCIIDSTSYVCACSYGYEWNGSLCKKTGAEECISVGGTWNSSNDKCTKIANWSSKPSNTVWNTVSSITQTWNGSSWEPSTTPTYSENGTTSECRYKCASDYEWNGSTCRSVDWSTLPECSKTSGTPCKDSSSGLIWSARSPSEEYSTSSYCDSLTEGGYSNWHKPTIDELKTLLINADRVTNNCQVSETNNCLSSSCWDCLTCTQTGTVDSIGACNSGTSYSDGRYSKFGSTGTYWSSSYAGYIDPFGYTWCVNFGTGVVDNAISSHNYKKLYVRCVR